jgi:small subunit ribosomal protein S18
MPKVKKRGKNKDNNRRAKKKISILSTEKIEYVDWKDANLLRRFLSERAKIRARRVTGNNAQQQKLVADAIKVAREMALVPYATRVTTQRSSRGDRDRGPRADGPAPRPSGPPPRSEEGDEAAPVAEADQAIGTESEVDTGPVDAFEEVTES